MNEISVIGPQQPQGNVPQLSATLPHFAVVCPPKTLWLVGAHGGAGVTTLSQLHPAFADAGRRWPQGSGSACVVMARTSASGLQAAQAVLTQWANGGAGTARLLGLVLVDDAPGRLPKPLTQMAHLISGGAPKTWRVPWNHAWRCGEPVGLNSPSTTPAVQRMAHELVALVITNPARKQELAAEARQFITQTLA